MFAVVQIGSSERRSPCITARMVRAGEGACARTMPETPESAVAASVPWTKRRRVVRMTVSLGFRRFTHGNAEHGKPPPCPARDAARQRCIADAESRLLCQKPGPGVGSASFHAGLRPGHESEYEAPFRQVV